MLNKIKKDLTKAIKNKDKEKRNTLRLVMNAINAYKKVNELTNEEITDKMIYAIVTKEIRQIRTLLDYALDNRRIDMLEQLGERLNVLDNYTPSQMTDEDVHEAGLVISHDFGIRRIENCNRGVIIKKAISLMQGKTDGPRVNRMITQIIKEQEDEEE